MPIPILVAVVAAMVSSIGTGTGVAIHNNNKHNKAKKQWQDEKRKLQEKIEEYQQDIVIKQKKISELQEKLKIKEEEKLKLTRELHECDRMIDELERKQREHESVIKMIIAFITFRYPAFKKESINLKMILRSNTEEKEMVLFKTKEAEEQQLYWQNDITAIEREVYYLENEIRDKENLRRSVIE